MKIKHWIIVIFFAVLAVIAGFYLHGKQHARYVKPDDIYPEKVVTEYYKRLDTRSGKNIGDLFMPYTIYQRWYLYDNKDRDIARLTAKMMKNIEYVKVRNIRKLEFDGPAVTFPKRDGSEQKFPVKDTVLYEVTYDIGYYDTKNRNELYSQYDNSGYRDEGRREYKNQKEKIWLVRLDSGAWKIVRFEQLKNK